MSKPTEKECKDAIDYFFYEEFIDKLTSEEYHHVKTLLNATAWWVLDLDLRWEEDDI